MIGISNMAMGKYLKVDKIKTPISIKTDDLDDIEVVAKNKVTQVSSIEMFHNINAYLINGKYIISVGDIIKQLGL